MQPSNPLYYERPTLSTSAGIVVEFVAKPMLITIAASFPTNLATNFSIVSWISIVPASERGLPEVIPYSFTCVSTALAQGPVF